MVCSLYGQATLIAAAQIATVLHAGRIVVSSLCFESKNVHDAPLLDNNSLCEEKNYFGKGAL